MKTLASQRGLTLVELLVAVMIGMATTGAVLGIAHKFFNIRNMAQNFSGRQVETTLALESVETALRSSVKIYPPEDLISNNDRRYSGIAKVPVGRGPAECLNQDNSHVLRLTTLRRYQKAERLYRTWRENDSAGMSGAANELRISIAGSAFASEDPAQKPQEIFLVDADVLGMRRYRVLSIVIRRNHDFDPADDLPKTNPDGSSRKFDYAALKLALPTKIDGSSTTKLNAVFIAQSMAYASDTFDFCVSQQTGELIRLREMQDQRMSLLSGDLAQYRVRDFKVSFGQVQRKKAMEDSDFVPDLNSLANPDCTNAVRFNLEMVPGDITVKAIQEAGAHSLPDQVSRQGTFFLQNFNLRRPASCP